MRELLPASLLYNRLTENLLLQPLVRYGFWRFQRTGRTPAASYSSFRKLHCLTRGQINRELSATIAQSSPPLQLDDSVSGILGQGPALATRIETAVAALRRDGIYVFPDRLEPALVRELVALAQTTETVLVPSPASGPARARFDPGAPRAPRYQFGEPQLLLAAPVQTLVADASFLQLASAYLGAMPINDLVTMWWSAPFGAASSEAAQLYHFDMDRIRFLKIFIYLTDVTPETGPHMYVRGSHAARPEAFFRDRRFTDEEVQRAFPPEDIRELTGRAGTIIAADTSGLHKGKALTAGSRLIFQLELTNSLFGQTYNRSRVDGSLADAVRRYPGVFQRFEAA